MATSATVRALIDPDLKRAAEDALERLGLSPSAAITLFYEQIVLRRGLPFEVAAPNSTTREAMADAEDGRVTRAPDGRSLIAQIDEDASAAERRDSAIHDEGTISARTLSMIDESVASLRAGVVGEPIDANAMLRALGED
jgi:DNA-damage-inducible protein J